MPHGLTLIPGANSVTVTLTSPSGQSIALYSDPLTQTPRANPFTITAPTTVWVRETVAATVSLKVGGVECATADGSTVVHAFTDWQVGSLGLYSTSATERASEKLDVTTASATYAPGVVVTGSGIDPTGVTDSASAIQTMIDARRDAVRSGNMGVQNVLVFPAGKYKIGTRLVVPPYVKIKTAGTVILEWFGSGDSCLHLTPLTDDPTTLYTHLDKQQWINSDLIAGQDGGLIILNRSASGTNTGLELGSRTDLGTSKPLSRYTISNVAVKGFQIGVRHGIYNHYIGRLDNCHIENNTTGVKIGDGATTPVNSGENFVYDRCVIADATTAIDYQAAGIDLFLVSCSIDFVTTAVRTAFAYGRFHFYGGHIEAINENLASTGGIVYSTNTSQNARSHVSFNGTVLLNRTQNLFKGPNLVVSGTVYTRATLIQPDTTYPNGLTCEDQVQANNLRTWQQGSNGRRITTRSVNRISDPYWNRESVGAVATLLDWTIVTNGTLSISTDSPESGGQSLVMVLPASGYCELTYKYDVPITDEDERFLTAAFKKSASTANLEGKFILKDYAGVTLATTTNTPSSDNASLASGSFHLPDFLIEMAAANLSTFYRASTMRPVITFSSSAGATITCPFVYMGR